MRELIASVDQLTMSSLEIAELTGKRHDNVMRDISRMCDELQLDPLKYEEVSRNANNQPVKIARLDKELTITLVSGYNTKMRNAIIKRWQDLENQQPTPLTLEEMTLRVVEGQKHRIMMLEHQIEQDAPLTSFGKAISQSAGTVKIGDWIKAINDSGDIKIGRNRAFRWFRDNGYLSKNNMPYQQYINSGLFEVKEGMVVTDKKTIQTFTTLLTGKGQMYFANKLKNQQIEEAA